MGMQEPVGVTNITPNLPTGQLWVAAKTELSTLEKYLLAFKHHERLLIVLAVLAFGTFGVSKALNYDGARKDAQVATLTAIVQQDKVSVQNLALEAQQAQAAYQTTLDAITKQNVALAQANAQDLASLAQRQTADRVLPPSGLAQRLEVLVPATQGGVTTTTDSMTLNTNAAVSVVSALEQVPVLQNELNNETQVADNNRSALDAASTVIADKAAQVGALTKSLEDQQAHEAAAVAAEKVKTKKAWRSGFKWGFAAGAAIVGALTHVL